MKNLISQSKKNKIDNLCKRFNITEYTINNDETLDVIGSVIIMDTNYTKLPLKFNKISGNFDCTSNRLSTLEGCPIEVGGDFDCNDNLLTELYGCPTKVGGHFNCSINKISTLKYAPTEATSDFHCNDNRLDTLRYAPNKVGGDFSCQSNRLTNLMHSPIEVGGSYRGYANYLRSIEGISQYIGDGLNLNNNYKLDNTSCVNYDINVKGKIGLYNNNLPELFKGLIDKDELMRIVLKYQRHFEIWNEDLTLNEDNYNDLIEEIEDGLR
jgi:hypothetical protein